MNTSLNHPVFKQDRLISLDVLRGFAILGILIMNIQSFSMPGAAYMNPMAYGDMSGANKWIWMLGHIFADQKFMTIFSILFGAGIVLFTENAERRSGRSSALHYRRTFWLLVFGLIHAHFIWYGDILVTYALCGAIVYLFRKKSHKTLIVLGIVSIGMASFISFYFGWSMSYWPVESLVQTKNSWQPPFEIIQQEIVAYTGNFSQQQTMRSSSALMLETFVFLTNFMWRAGGLMLVGMAFYKMGILSAFKSKEFYQRGWCISWAIGLPLIAFGIVENFDHNWSMEYSMFFGSQFNYWGSLFMAFGYICGVMLWIKTTLFERIKVRLAAVGRMALTNYLMQSLICVFVFYGSGLALFGSLSRVEQLAIVLIVWVLQLAWSYPWLQNFRFGPFEWLWRSLSYKKKQPFKAQVSIE